MLAFDVRDSTFIKLVVAILQQFFQMQRQFVRFSKWSVTKEIVSDGSNTDKLVGVSAVQFAVCNFNNAEEYSQNS